MAPTRKPKKSAATNKSHTDAAAAPEPKTALRIVERPSHFKGIEQLVFAEASSLSDNPKNWKTHTKRQTEALDAEFETVGWAGALLYNLNTGRLIDGHGRQKTKHVRKTGVVPVMVGRWTEQEEEQILLHLDPVGAMFETDRAKYDALMKGHQKALEEFSDTITQESKTALDDLNKSLDLQIKSIDYGAPTSFLPSYDEEDVMQKREEESKKDIVDLNSLPADLPGTLGLKTWSELPFNCYGTSGILGIPPLLPDRIPTLKQLAVKHGELLTTWVGPETPEGNTYFYIYGCAAVEKVRSNRMIVAFYTWDQKFESVWNDPRPFTARMLHCKVLAAVTPNYSCWTGAPPAWCAYQIYRSRWLGRYWQDAGLKVIPDVQLIMPDETAQDTAIMLAGIPIGANCISIQVQTHTDVDDNVFFPQSKLAMMHTLSILQPKCLIAYRSPKTPKNFFDQLDIPVIQVETWMNSRKKALATRNAETGQTYLSTGVT